MRSPHLVVPCQPNPRFPLRCHGETRAERSHSVDADGVLRNASQGGRRIRTISILFWANAIRTWGNEYEHMLRVLLSPTCASSSFRQLHAAGRLPPFAIRCRLESADTIATWLNKFNIRAAVDLIEAAQQQIAPVAVFRPTQIAHPRDTKCADVHVARGGETHKPAQPTRANSNCPLTSPGPGSRRADSEGSISNERRHVQ